MKRLLQLASFTGLALTVLPAFFVFGGGLSWATHAALMLAGTVLWFATAPFWMRDTKSEAPTT